MAERKQLNAQEAVDDKGHVAATAYVCPYPNCGVYSLHHWGTPGELKAYVGESKWRIRNVSDDPSIVLSLCEACGQEVVFINERLAWPRTLAAPAPSRDLPPELQADFEEARQIHADSPRGAAALLRLVIQKLLPLVGASKKDINTAIGELVETGVITPAIQRALDTVRVIGNEAVHPGELDLRDDEATVLSLFNLVNFIVEKAITEPKEIEEIYRALPAGKRAGIDQRDAKGR